MSIPVVTVGRSAEDFVSGLERLHGPVTIVRRCSELPELIAACQSGIARAAIIAEEAGGLTSSLIDRLASSDVAVVALADQEEERARLTALGVRNAPGSITSQELAELVSHAVEDLVRRQAVPAGRISASYADPADALFRGPVQSPETPAEDDGGPAGEGTVTAVWGPAGAPGRTTVAVNLAAELAGTGIRVLLIDADTYGASIAPSLGLLDESAGLAQACRLADQGTLDVKALERVSAQVVIKGAPLRVLTGIPRADRWAELRAAALAEVIRQARGVADAIIIDCGFCLEADEELSFDTMAPRRNGATLRCLELADTIYAVGSADAIGIPRLVRGLAELEQAVPSASPQVILNKVRAASVGRSPERQLREAWERYGPAQQIQAFLPADAAAADAALLGGSALLEVAPESPLRRALADLVDAPVERRRGLRRGGRGGVKFSPAGIRLLPKGPQGSGL
jgi:Mrp family chromosome partitioning ATPase